MEASSAARRDTARVGESACDCLRNGMSDGEELIDPTGSPCTFCTPRCTMSTAPLALSSSATALEQIAAPRPPSLARHDARWCAAVAVEANGICLAGARCVDRYREHCPRAYGDARGKASARCVRRTKSRWLTCSWLPTQATSSNLVPLRTTSVCCTAT